MDAQKIFQIEQMKLIYHHMPVVLSASFVTGAVLTAVMYITNQDTTALLWYGVVFLFTSIRYLLFFKNKKEGLNSKNYRAKRVELLTFSFFSGILWGSAGVIFFNPEQPFVAAMVTLVIAGMTSGSVSSTSAYPPIYYAYTFPAMLPLTFVTLFSGNTFIVSFGVLLLYFLLVNVLFCKNVHKTILETLKLRFENDELIDELKEQKIVADNANISKSKFLAAASHDLRQPLHAQGLFLEGLADEKLTERGQLIYQNILNSKNALDSLFNSLLDISRLDAGIIEPNVKVFNLQHAINQLAAEHRQLAQEKELDFDLILDEVIVETDPILLERIIRNLLKNAIHYTDSGSVDISCKRENGQAIICVEDTGQGIPEVEKNKIFSEFYQLNNPERDRNKGLGLGLAIVDRLTSLLGIHISLESDTGKGTLVKLRMPTSVKKPTQEGVQAVIRSDHTHINILVIDDETAILLGMDQVLTGFGHRCLTASSAEIAIQTIVEIDFVPDLVIADYRLREEKTGIEAIKNICEEMNMDIPGIIITGDTEPQRIIDIERNGFKVLFKPVKPQVLKQVIDEVYNL